MKTLAQPAAPVPAAGPVSAMLPVALQPQPRAEARPATSAKADDDSDERTEQMREFYAWCAGCEGFGSIF